MERTSRAPPSSKVAAHSRSVAPVVVTSSTRATAAPLRAESVATTAKARRTLSRRSLARRSVCDRVFLVRARTAGDGETGVPPEGRGQQVRLVEPPKALSLGVQRNAHDQVRGLEDAPAALAFTEPQGQPLRRFVPALVLEGYHAIPERARVDSESGPFENHRMAPAAAPAVLARGSGKGRSAATLGLLDPGKATPACLAERGILGRDQFSARDAGGREQGARERVPRLRPEEASSRESSLR